MWTACCRPPLIVLLAQVRIKSTNHSHMTITYICNWFDSLGMSPRLTSPQQSFLRPAKTHGMENCLRTSLSFFPWSLCSRATMNLSLTGQLPILAPNTYQTLIMNIHEIIATNQLSELIKKKSDKETILSCCWSKENIVNENTGSNCSTHHIVANWR